MKSTTTEAMTQMKDARHPDPEWVTKKRQKRMNRIDNLPKEIRALVHEYGLTVVGACLDLGVKKPGQIKHLVETILDEFSPTRGSFSKQGIRTNHHEKGKPPMRSNLIDLTLHLHHSTELAIRVSLTGDNDKAVWLPKSQIEYIVRLGAIVEVTLPEHLAIEKGLV